MLIIGYQRKSVDCRCSKNISRCYAIFVQHLQLLLAYICMTDRFWNWNILHIRLDDVFVYRQFTKANIDKNEHMLVLMVYKEKKNIFWVNIWDLKIREYSRDEDDNCQSEAARRSVVVYCAEVDLLTEKTKNIREEVNKKMYWLQMLGEVDPRLVNLEFTLINLEFKEMLRRDSRFSLFVSDQVVTIPTEPCL